MKATYLIVSFIFLFSCTPEKQEKAIATAEKTVAKETLKAPVDYSDIKVVYATANKALRDTDAMLFNQLIATDGLFVYTSGGAMPALTKVNDIENLKVNDLNIFEKINSKLSVTFREEALPEKDCDSKNFYTKQGSYGSEANDVKVQEIWKYTNADKILQEEAKKAADKVSYTIINTEFGIFYFGKVNGQWKLFFLDLRKPCNA